MTPRRANTPVLTREQIVSAAIAIVDRESLNALSMRKLASELGVGPMSLYYHVPDKSALHDLILEAVMNETDLSGDDPTTPAEERVIAVAHALRNALLAHPNASPIALSRSLRTPGQLRPAEAMVGILFDIGLEPTDAITAVDVLGQYVFGTTLAYANHLADSEFHDAMRDEDLSAVTAEDFPNMYRLTQEAEYVGWDGEFERGLHALVRGLVLDRLKP